MTEERTANILVAPHISEKSNTLTETNNQFVFKVARMATKVSVKRAVEILFDVKVTNVRLCNVKGKSRQFGGVSGRTKPWKKAYVSLVEGETLDFVSPEE